MWRSRSSSIAPSETGFTWTLRGSRRRSASLHSRTLQPAASPNCRKISVERVAMLAEKSVDEKEIETELQSLILTNRKPLSTTTKVVLRDSWEALSYESPASIGLLHLKVYMNSSEVQTKYPQLGTSMEVKKTIDETCKQAHWQQTMNTIGVAITHLDNFETVAKIMRKIGARHTNIDDTVHIECYFAGLEHTFNKMLRFNGPASHDHIWHHFWAILKSEFTLGWTRMRHDSCNYCPKPP
ncbi:uncharacterized protein [Littorina saxatilis]|uniref:uncharacterized protein n=1 Tax=Littorina saxatilis TaxID=31220 RepID=UPI0038B54FAA